MEEIDMNMFFKMHKAVVAFTLAFFSMIPCLTFAEKANHTNEATVVVLPEFQPDELLVKYRASALPAQARAEIEREGAREVREFRRSRKASNNGIERWRLIRVNHAGDLERVRNSLSRNPLVEKVEYNHKVSLQLTPSDASFNTQWALDNTGQTGGKPNADINAPQAWDITTGGSNVIVAVIDSGVDYLHPDLAANMWVNPGEIPGNKIDDDRNGYVDDVHGYDFLNKDGDPMDDNGHGTHVAGTIAAVTNNATGIAGVSWNAKIMALKFTDATGSGSVANAISAILYAANMGAKVMNNSWGGPSYSELLFDAISDATFNITTQQGSLFVAAAGNSFSNNDDYLNKFYPASYNITRIVSVAATNHNDDRSYFSNVGINSVDIAAPGEAIFSTIPTTQGSYGYKSGTSMAAPHVAGVAALLYAQNPTLHPVWIKNILTGSAQSLPALQRVTASGRLDAGAATQRMLTCSSTPLTADMLKPGVDFLAFSGEPNRVAVLLTRGCGMNASTFSNVRATFSDGSAELVLYDNGENGDGVAGDSIFSNSWAPVANGSVTISITAELSGATASATQSGNVKSRPVYAYENIPYEWTDTTNGVNFTYPADKWATSTPLGFEFEYYGIKYKEIFINSNGQLGFGGSARPYEWLNVALPSAYAPNTVVSVFWDDFILNSTNAPSRLQWKTEGVTPNRRFTVSWIDAVRTTTTGNASFQVTIFESSKEIVMRYRDVVFGNPSYDFGASATVGVESENGMFATQYSYNQAVLADQTALRFYPVYPQTNHLPIANPGGPYTGYRNQPINFNGSASSDADGDALTYAWNFGDGTPVSETNQNPTYSYTQLGTFNVALTVNDGVASSAAATTATILNLSPVTNAGSDHTVNSGTVVQLSGSSSDADGSIVAYEWTQTSGPSVIVLNPTSVNASFIAPLVTVATALTFRLTVTDNDGATALDEVTVTVSAKSGVDLLITDLKTSTTSVKRGSKFTITYTVKNAGNTNTNRDFYTGFYLSADAVITTADKRIDQRNTSSLAAGVSSTITRTVTVPSTMTPGVYNVGAIIDYTNRQTEINETNNACTGPAITVTR